jgi:RHS repeat-associated protein
MHGFDSYDFGARGYYPTIGNFKSVDPLCEKYYRISPYAYCLNNPVKYVDPDGRYIWEE